MERLDKFLCDCGVGTRSQVKAILKSGRVTVDGVPERDNGRKIDPASQSICFDGEALNRQGRVVVMMNKPAGFVTATQDAREKTVMELLPADMKHLDLKPVGRLDKATEGLLLFTNDGELANRLMHPAAEANKTYLVTVTGYYEGAEERLAQSMVIDGYRIRPAKVKNIMHHGEEAQLQITIHEGRNRQIRKMCETVGIRVKKLQRVEENGVKLGNLPLGQWRWLTEEEIKILQEFHK